MLLKDYAEIILIGIYDSPNFWVNHLKRELNKAEKNGFDKSEFEFDLRQTISLIKNRIEDIYSKDLKEYKKQCEEDKTLPKENRYYYPKPIKEKISILSFSLPDGYKFSLPKAIFLEDLEKVESALNDLLNDANSLPLNKSGFTLSKKKGAKIDLIRVLNALYSMQYFVKENSGQLPNKIEFMQRFGEYFGIDLSTYDADLSQAFNNGTIESNLKVFEKMKTITFEIIDSKI